MENEVETAVPAPPSPTFPLRSERVCNPSQLSLVLYPLVGDLNKNSARKEQEDVRLIPPRRSLHGNFLLLPPALAYCVCVYASNIRVRFKL